MIIFTPECDVVSSHIYRAYLDGDERNARSQKYEGCGMADRMMRTPIEDKNNRNNREVLEYISFPFCRQNEPQHNQIISPEQYLESESRLSISSLP